MFFGIKRFINQAVNDEQTVQNRDCSVTPIIRVIFSIFMMIRICGFVSD